MCHSMKNSGCHGNWKEKHSNSFKQLLWNQLAECHKISYVACLHQCLPSLFKWYHSMKNFSCHGDRKEKLENSFKQLLQNQAVECHQISYVASLYQCLPSFFKWFRSMKNSGCHGNRMEKLRNSFQWHLLQSLWAECLQISCVVSLYWDVPSLCKWFCSVKNSGCHGDIKETT